MKTKMLTGKEFVAKIKEDNAELFAQSRSNVRRFFASNPSKEHMVEHFRGRMVNEAMNMKAIAAEVASAPASMDVTELELLTKQAQDEAKHFRMVKEVIEHISGERVDVDAAFAAEAAAPQAKGATLLDKYGASSDPAALAAYQLVAEGRAEAVWNEMAECVEDDFISSRYSAIAKDEGFHANIGGWKLEKLVEGAADVQERILAMVEQMRYDLLEISNKNTAIAV
jgi:1,2-phenylacetyl-CoA epoxidase catalytic subunit